MLSAYHGHAPLVKLLLQHGADPNRLNDRGQSPLAGAVFKNERQVIQALLEGQADPRLGEPSALDACRVGPEMVEIDANGRLRLTSCRFSSKKNLKACLRSRWRNWTPVGRARGMAVELAVEVEPSNDTPCTFIYGNQPVR
jgi:ankyrin repeat protein